MTNLPWSNCKIAFDIDDEDVWSHLDEDKLPEGWEASESYSSPIACMLIFDVDVLPTVEDARKVKSLLRSATKRLKKYNEDQKISN